MTRKQFNAIIAVNSASCEDQLASILNPIVHPICASSAREILESLHVGDIIIMEWDGKSDAVPTFLSQWISQDKGPACVLVPESTPGNVVDHLYQCGASHVLQSPVGTGTIVSVISQYVHRLMLERRIGELSHSLKTVQRVVILLIGIIVAISLGDGRIVSIITRLF
jgi:hypothetical protein